MPIHSSSFVHTSESSPWRVKLAVQPLEKFQEHTHLGCAGYGEELVKFIIMRIWSLGRRGFWRLLGSFKVKDDDFEIYWELLMIVMIRFWNTQQWHNKVMIHLELFIIDKHKNESKMFKCKKNE